MLKKSFAFSLLAAGLMIAPTTAFAEQSQINFQDPINDPVVSDSAKSIIERATQTNGCYPRCI